jgi:hypothetical protein
MPLMLPVIAIVTDDHCRIPDPLPDLTRFNRQECKEPGGEAKDRQRDLQDLRSM